MDICCGQKMLSVLDFDNYRPSSRCGLCFGSGKFYLGSAVNQLDGCECVKRRRRKEKVFGMPDLLLQQERFKQKWRI